MIYILDASAMIAYLRNEEGAVFVGACLLERANESYSHAVNLCEVFYDFRRTGGEQTAQAAIGDLLGVGIRAREDLSSEFWQAAGRVKAVHRRVSLADCFAIALAQSMGGTVLTCDHHEFDAIAAGNPCPVTFIR